MNEIKKIESNKYMEQLLENIAEEERYSILKKHLGKKIYEALRSNNIFYILVAREELLYKSQNINKNIKKNALLVIDSIINESNITIEKLKNDLIEYAKHIKDEGRLDNIEYYKFSANSRRYTEDLFFKGIITKENFQEFVESGLNNFFRVSSFGIEFNFDNNNDKE